MAALGTAETTQPRDGLAVDNHGHLYVVGTAPDGNSEANVQKFRLPPLP